MGFPQVGQNCLDVINQEVIIDKKLIPPPPGQNILAYRFPSELYVKIFSFLGCLESLLGVLKVCKEWKAQEKRNFSSICGCIWVVR